MDDIALMAKNLLKKGYDVKCFPAKSAAAAYLNEVIDDTITGIGGSQTVAQLGLYDMLAAHNTVYWHDRKPAGMTIADTRLAATRAKVYISSVNAISLAGDIVNIDATGNRVAAISYGPEDVYLVFGRNKITPDLHSAIYRARNIAAPLNAVRLKRKTPCAVKGDKCYNCSSPERICRNFSVIREKPFGPRYHVVIIDEDLGY